jgi:hypothetical protein
VADAVLDAAGGEAQDRRDLGRIAVVFGGRRPQLFLKRILAKRLGGEYLPPRFFTIDEWMAEIVRSRTGFTTLNDLDNCYELFLIARRSVPEIVEGRSTFAAFLPWAREILAFIDQLDLEDIPETRLRNISAQASIGYDVPADINALLEKILVLRREYHSLMEEKKAFSRGFQYLQAARSVSEADLSGFERVIFANFFYFHRTEMQVVKHLFDSGKTDLLFQGDGRYWSALNKVGEQLGVPLIIDGQLQPPAFDLQLYSSNDLHGQVGLVREIVKKLADPARTVIVVPSSDAIVPLLSELNQVVKDYNISMGYPLKRSSLYNLLESIFACQNTRKGNEYYARDYLRVLLHPFVKNIEVEGEPALTRIMTHKIEEMLKGDIVSGVSGKIFVTLDEITGCEEVFTATRDMAARLGISADRDAVTRILDEIHRVFFRSWESADNFAGLAASIREMLDIVTNRSFLCNFPLNGNIAAKMYVLADELAASAFNLERFPPDDLFRIFDNRLSREVIAFRGSPLKGLQVLGLFETRSLHFDNIIVMDANEGVLPNLKVHEPLIPRDVMVSLGLDRLELEEEIQRYQFMRLIAGARQVHLVYLENKEKERSRFVEQLIWNKELAAGKPSPVPLTIARFPVKVKAAPVQIAKTPEMMRILDSMTYSASSVNVYLNNPIDFYWQYVLGLRQKEDMLDEPEDRKVGTFLHSILEEAYKPFVGKKPVIDDDFEKRLMSLFETGFESDLAKSMRSDAFLLKNIIKHRLERLVENERTREITEIVCLEKQFRDSLELPCGRVNFKFIVDRIDRLEDGSVLIIDYKSGGRDQMPQKVEEVAKAEGSREMIARKIKSFQLPLYYLHMRGQFPGKCINAAVYSLRSAALECLIKDSCSLPPEEIEAVFKTTLNTVMCEILDPAVPFIDSPVNPEW